MSNDTVREWMLAYRARVKVEFEALSLKLTTLDAMIAELGEAPTGPFWQPPPVTGPEHLDTTRPPWKPPAPIGESADKLIATALNSALGETPAKPPSMRGKHGQGGRTKGSSNTTKMVMTALEAAGAEGLTGRELADLASMPKGTATSRLSLMARDGVVHHDGNSHRYFVVHSTQEDNNEAVAS